MQLNVGEVNNVQSHFYLVTRKNIHTFHSTKAWMPKDKKPEYFIANNKLLEKSTEYSLHINI